MGGRVVKDHGLKEPWSLIWKNWTISLEPLNWLLNICTPSTRCLYKKLLCQLWCTVSCKVEAPPQVGKNWKAESSCECDECEPLPVFPSESGSGSFPCCSSRSSAFFKSLMSAGILSASATCSSCGVSFASFRGNMVPLRNVIWRMCHASISWSSAWILIQLRVRNICWSLTGTLLALAKWPPEDSMYCFLRVVRGKNQMGNVMSTTGTTTMTIKDLRMVPEMKPKRLQFV